MAYLIDFTAVALDDLKSLRKGDQQTVVDGIEIQLQYEPIVETRNRKRLRPNRVADWELRVGKFRVFYNVKGADEESQRVSIEAIGFKIGSLLFIRGKQVEL